MHTKASLMTLSRRELQDAAKAAGLRANAKSSVLIDQLMALADTLEQMTTGAENTDIDVTAKAAQREKEHPGAPPPAPRPSKVAPPPLPADLIKLPSSIVEPKDVVLSPQQALAESALRAAATTAITSPAAPDSTPIAAASGSAFFGDIYQRVAVIAASPTAQHPDLRRSLNRLSSVLLDNVIVARSASKYGSTPGGSNTVAAVPPVHESAAVAAEAVDASGLQAQEEVAHASQSVAPSPSFAAPAFSRPVSAIKKRPLSSKQHDSAGSQIRSMSRARNPSSASLSMSARPRWR